MAIWKYIKYFGCLNNFLKIEKKNSIIKLSNNSSFVILTFAISKFRNIDRSAFRRYKFWPPPPLYKTIRVCTCLKFSHIVFLGAWEEGSLVTLVDIRVSLAVARRVSLGGKYVLEGARSFGLRVMHGKGSLLLKSIVCDIRVVGLYRLYAISDRWIYTHDESVCVRETDRQTESERERERERV